MRRKGLVTVVVSQFNQLCPTAMMDDDMSSASSSSSLSSALPSTTLINSITRAVTNLSVNEENQQQLQVKKWSLICFFIFCVQEEHNIVRLEI